MATEILATLIPPDVPFINPAPGRCVVRIVPQLLETKTDSGIDLQIDLRRKNQPQVGFLLALGDPRNESEKIICDWAIEETRLEHLFVFSEYGMGSPYWNEEMEKMVTSGYDFRWLQGLRLFDIGQLGATIQNCGSYGELLPAPRLILQ